MARNYVTANFTTSGTLAKQISSGSGRMVRFTFTGTYTGVTCVLQGSNDGTNYVALASIREDTGAAFSGSVSAANFSALANVGGWSFVRGNVTTVGSGTFTLNIDEGANMSLPLGITPISLSSLGTAITSASANAFAVGPSGTTNPGFNVDASAASAVTGLNVVPNAAASGLALAVVSSGSDENLTIDAKGAGTITLNATATGAVACGRVFKPAVGITSSASTLPIAGLASTSTTGGSVSVTGGATTNGGSAGGAVTVTGGQGGAAGAGGAITLAGGQPASSNAVGGAAGLAGGAGGGTGAGGALALAGGASGGGATGNGGAASLVGGAAVSTAGTGGAVTITGGLGTTSGLGGAMTVASGKGGDAAAGGTGAAGGAFSFTSGAGGTTATGTGGSSGTATFASGAGGAATGAGTGGAGALLALTGGVGGATTSSTGGAGAAVTVTAGAGGAASGAGTGGAGGCINLVPGAGGTTSGGTAGRDGTTYINRGVLAVPIIGLTLTALGTVQSSTPTSAQLLGGLLSQTGSTGAGTVTLPTGTALSAACARTPVVGDTFDCEFYNLGGSQTLTITGATGTTVVGTAAVGTGKMAKMKFYNSGSNTWNIYTIVSA